MAEDRLPAVPGATASRRQIGGVDLHVVAAGDPADPLVVLLHGFPDFWYGWREQLPGLVEAGYRVLVPDQRGYNRSDAPTGLDAYRTSVLSRDVAGLIASEGRDRAHVVGHDWGAAVAWDLALRQPAVVDRLGIINVPHPTVLRRTLRSNPRQLARSWYVFAFQLPGVPEWALGRRDGALLARLLRESANPGTFSEADLARYRAAWRRGSIRAMVDYYRAAARRPESLPRRHVQAPALVLWGEDDVALVPEMAEESLTYCVDGDLQTFPAASHWVHLEESDAVTDALVDHLGD